MMQKYSTKSKTEQDSTELQNDLNEMNVWSEHWLLKLNAEKCKLLTIGKKNISTKYVIQSLRMN